MTVERAQEYADRLERIVFAASDASRGLEEYVWVDKIAVLDDLLAVVNEFVEEL